MIKKNNLTYHIINATQTFILVLQCFNWHYYTKLKIGGQNRLTEAVFATASEQRSQKMTYFLRRLCARLS